MVSVNSKILVSCDLEQKEFMEVGGMQLKMATLYETNYRERSPVLAISQQTKGEIVKGDILICHHNHFYAPSPYFISDNLYSIPFNHTIFAIIDKQGNPKPVCGNILVEKVDIPTVLPLPPEQREQYIDRYIVADAGYTPYKKGQMVFTKPNSGYEIVFNLNNQEKRAIKINSEMIVGYI